jgi:2-keto-4-pentenoate hydratase
MAVERSISDQQAATEAERLLDAELTRVPVGPVSKRVPGLTIDDAYAIQSCIIERRCAGGARPVGRKVGLTSAAMQEMLGVSQPDYGVVLDSMVRDPASGIDSSTLIAPRVEAEIGFWLSAPLVGFAVSVDDVLAATSHVCVALEIIDSRIADWKITITDTIADNASSALVVLGQRIPFDGQDLATEQATVTVGERSASGRGAAVLGHPAEGVAWLARTLAPRGLGLAAGEFVIPGAVAAALPFAPGDVIRAEYASLGQLEVAVR